MLSAFLLLAATPSLSVVSPPSQVGRMVEWEVRGLPTPVRPYDASDWSIQATVTYARQKPTTLTAFWYRPFTRGKGADGKEAFTPAGKPGWRIRFAPMAPGTHTIAWRVFRQGQPTTTVARSRFTVSSGPLKGFVRVSKTNPEYLAHADGSRFLPIGMNTSWWNEGGTRDYDRWAANMQKAGMNYGRLWMAPWSFGIEQAPGQLGNYALDRAWALDLVLETFRRRGVQVILCFDYHGMLQQTKDFWGSNDNWSKNPYNAALGGPAKTQNDFFTNLEAKRLYKQRLRYLAARYAAYSNVAVWEFWNEIDNVRQHFQEKDMIAWHAEMAREIRRLDPYGRGVSTSLTSDVFPSIWTDAELDLVQSHSYNQTNPGLDFAARAKRFREKYRKPYIVGEYGVDWRAAMSENDPKNRGLQQALWGSLLGGGAGTAQSWWWETLDAQNAYPLFAGLARFVEQTSIGAVGWKPMEVETPSSNAELGEPLAGQPPFDVKVELPLSWGEMNSGTMVVASPLGARASATALNGYLHGTTKPDLRRPFKVRAHFAAGAEVCLKLNSVSNGAELVALVDGSELWRKAFPDKDGKWDMNNEYGEEIVVPIPLGTHTFELRNEGPDWAGFDWIEVKRVRPARSSSRAEVRGVASGNATSAVVWLLDPAYSYPANAKELQSRPVSGATATLVGLADGDYQVRWYDALAGRWASTARARSTGGRMALAVPAFREHLAALIKKSK